MSNARNQVFLIGNLGQDPEMRTTLSGKTVTQVSLATNERYRNQQGDLVETTQWHRLVGWGKKAELMNDLFRKGQSLAVNGKLTYRSYEDTDGRKRYITEVIVQDFTLLGKREAQPA